MKAVSLATLIACLLSSSFSRAEDGLESEGSSAPVKSAPVKNAEHDAFFEERIRPVLVSQCYECHSDESEIVQGGLRLDTREQTRTGGDSGPAVVPGDLDASLLIDALNHDTFEMPPSGKLPEPVIEDFTRWIQAGAYDPREATLADASSIEVRREDGILNRIDYEVGRKFWSFIPPEQQQPPAVQQADWVRTPIDAFVLAKLEAANVTPSGSAERETLLRRVKFDLVGLPPTPAEVDAFVSDDQPEAYERLVERLLASPHYGERWGRHWLDLVRYSDSNGLDENYYFGHAWRYRDYVVQSFNDDKPYDQFITEQLAGDLLAKQPEIKADRQRYEHALTATGFLAIGPKMQAEPDNQKRVMDTVDELIDVSSQTFLGLSVACARCHSHKFDPISARDYYALAGVFRSCAGKSGKRREISLTSEEDNKKLQQAKQQLQEVTKQLREAEQARKKFDRSLLHSGDAQEGDSQDSDQSVAAKPTAAQRKAKKQYNRLKARIAELKRQKEEAGEAVDAFPTVHSMHQDKPQNVPIHIRGSHTNLAKQPVPRGTLVLLENSVGSLEIDEQAPGRLELAKWLTDPNNPLTARVLVNRIWQGHFGRGLVTTPNDFGFRGSLPTHPRLLDYLAVDFVEHGWSIKRLHRQVMLSNTYRQSSQYREDAAAIDSENMLLWRQNRRRLEAEPLRDNLLAVAGLLDKTLGGSIFKFRNGSRVTNDQSANFAAKTYESRRRAIYIPMIRVATYAMFANFDLSDPSRPIASRNASVIAPQALYLMNGKLPAEAAAGFAKRVQAFDSDEPADRIRYAYHLAYGREPTTEEVRMSEQFLESQTQLSPEQRWTDYCQALMAASEFIYID